MAADPRALGKRDSLIPEIVASRAQLLHLSDYYNADMVCLFLTFSTWPVKMAGLFEMAPYTRHRAPHLLHS